MAEKTAKLSVELTMKEFISTFDYLISNNKKLVAEGKTPLAISIEGKAGIGKSQAIENYAKEHEMTMCKINLAQLEDQGDLLGYPYIEYWVEKIQKEGNETKVLGGMWVPEKLIQLYTKDPSLRVTIKTRKCDAMPSWLPRKSNPNGTILFLDDYNRAQPIFMQSCMELINEGKYATWKLPENTTIVLSNNPEGDEYEVSSMDSAQKTRYLNFKVVFNIAEWAEWAEKNMLDNRAINFAIQYARDLFEPSQEGVQIANARSYTNFCKALGSIKDWSTDESLSLIQIIAKGCFSDDVHNVIGQNFISFISLKMDKLPHPKNILEDKWEDIKKVLVSCMYDDKDSIATFRPEIAGILAQRFINYSNYYLGDSKNKESVIRTRIVEMLTDKERTFSDDNMFSIVRNIYTNNRKRTINWFENASLRKYIGTF